MRCSEKIYEDEFCEYYEVISDGPFNCGKYSTWYEFKLKEKFKTKYDLLIKELQKRKF